MENVMEGNKNIPNRRCFAMIMSCGFQIKIHVRKNCFILNFLKRITNSKII